MALKRACGRVTHTGARQVIFALKDRLRMKFKCVDTVVKEIGMKKTTQRRSTVLGVLLKFSTLAMKVITLLRLISQVGSRINLLPKTLTWTNDLDWLRVQKITCVSMVLVHQHSCGKKLRGVKQIRVVQLLGRLHTPKQRILLKYPMMST